MADEKKQGPDSAPAGALDYVPGHVNGVHRPTDDEEDEDGQEAAGDGAVDDEPEEIAPMPPAVAELAAACVRFVASKYGVALDFGPDTLSLVDQYVREARAELETKSEGDRQGHLLLLQASIGAYLGEVIRRAHRGLWFCTGEHDGWRVRMTRVYLELNPIGMAREALTLETAEGWGAHLETDPAERDALAERLAALGEVEDDEFYAPTTRFDIVEIAVEALAARARSNGLGDVRFTAEDYE